MRRSSFSSAVLAGLLSLALGGAAEANLLVNGSFESGAFAANSDGLMSLGPGSTTMTGWTVITDTLSWIEGGSAFSLSASQGTRFLDLTDYAGGAPFGGVQQTVATTAGTVYRLTFDLGSSDLYGTPTGVTATAAGVSQTFSSPTSGGGTNLWQTMTMDFTALSASTLVVLQGQAGVFYLGLDNVVLTVVPEPASAALALAGLVAVAGAARRRRGG